MAGSARYTAILDANVLYPLLMRDVLLSLAHADLYSARWSADIQREWMDALVGKFPGQKAKIAKTADLMRQSIPDCMVTGYESLVPSLTLPDPDDRHVLAAAITGHADAIVTLNTKDFPEDVLDPFVIERQTPDEFVVNQIMLNKIRALAALKGMRQRWERPEVTPAALIDLFAQRNMPLTAAHLADAVARI